MHTVTNLSVLCLSLFLLVSCGGGGGGDTSTNTTTSTLISPAGGTAASKDGKLMLEFPAGALTGENTITIKKLAPEDVPSEFDGLEGDAYEFGPDGLTFDVPVTLTLESDEDVVTADGEVGGSLAFLISNGEADLFILDELENVINEVAGTVTTSGKMSHFSTVVRTKTFVGLEAKLALAAPDTAFKDVVFEVDFTLTLSEDFIEFLESHNTYAASGKDTVKEVDIASKAIVPGVNNANFLCTDIGAGSAGINATIEVTLAGSTPSPFERHSDLVARIKVISKVNCVGSDASTNEYHETDPTGDMIATAFNINTVDDPPAATDITAVDVTMDGDDIVGKITFAGDAEAYNNATTDKFPVSLQFHPIAGGPFPEVFFDTKTKIKTSNGGTAISYEFSGNCLTFRIGGLDLADMQGIRASTFPYIFDMSGTLEYTDEVTSPGY